VRNNLTIDWTVRENVRAQLRVLVKRILRKYGYPPDKQKKATQTVLEQAEVLSGGWAPAVPEMRIRLGIVQPRPEDRYVTCVRTIAGRHSTITLKPVNPEFEPIELTDAQEGQVQVIAECVEVLGELVMKRSST